MHVEEWDQLFHCVLYLKNTSWLQTTVIQATWFLTRTGRRVHITQFSCCLVYFFVINFQIFKNNSVVVKDVLTKKNQECLGKLL